MQSKQYVIMYKKFSALMSPLVFFVSVIYSFYIESVRSTSGPNEVSNPVDQVLLGSTSLAPDQSSPNQSGQTNEGSVPFYLRHDVQVLAGSVCLIILGLVLFSNEFYTISYLLFIISALGLFIAAAIYMFFSDSAK